MADRLTDGVAASSNPGVTVSIRDDLGCATIMVRRGADEQLKQRVKTAYGIDLVPGPRRTASGNVAFLGVGPVTWLATQDDGGNGFSVSFKQAVGDAASVTDQTDGYVIHRVSGPRVRQALARGFPIDLHNRAFAPGAVAVTAVSHLGAIIWRLDDLEDGTPVFEIAVFRSLVDSFRRWLDDSLAGFGLARN
ncbi:sarcosine oxidase subunit gamma family protein [Bradyrhizobium sp. 191]|uniref:sarcosine oxidase subunit gamma n=1 Tax=Bradyrhizobium sp. 191 TaxID=2782659 RepID=UPI001FFEFB92|nr:sarcosine oxidase subunit gamma family protein [Bradyrhizobium sp. 191]UPJ67267.1 sarcosine oxidase subunit gamma [Bradyrhizobium sp. 191]